MLNSRETSSIMCTISMKQFLNNIRDVDAPAQRGLRGYKVAPAGHAKRG
jgi:hypothetical protein